MAFGPLDWRVSIRVRLLYLACSCLFASSAWADLKAANCTCDCCATATRDTSTLTLAKLHCAHISDLSFKANEELAELVGPRCPNRCTDPIDGDASDTFLSKKDVIEASRFCFDKCAAVLPTLNSQCIDMANAKKIKPHHALVHKNTATAGTGTEIGGVNPLDAANDTLVKARIDAVMAGEAAKAAKMAFETANKHAGQLAAAAKKNLMQEVADANQAHLAKRNAVMQEYQDKAHENARNAAIAIAKVYGEAFVKARNVQGIWALRASEYDSAAASRTGLAAEYEATAKSYAKQKEFQLSEDYELDAAKMKEKAAEYEAKAKEAHKTAGELMETLKWYMWAQQQAAMHQLAINTPRDVWRIPLPPLPIPAR